LLETPYGNVLFQDSMGFFTGLYAHTPVDVALLAAAGRGHIDGEPIQGAVEDFIARECELLRPRRVILSHHDNFTGAPDAPDVTDVTPVHEELARTQPDIEILTMELGGSITLFE
jgi:L-ascorbate metabolism protein UlaG (beta-lactamase superfamily)